MEPTVVSTQASSSPSYGPNIAPARMFYRITSGKMTFIVTRHYYFACVKISLGTHRSTVTDVKRKTDDLTVVLSGTGGRQEM